MHREVKTVFVKLIKAWSTWARFLVRATGLHFLLTRRVIHVAPPVVLTGHQCHLGCGTQLRTYSLTWDAALHGSPVPAGIWHWTPSVWTRVWHYSDNQWHHSQERYDSCSRIKAKAVGLHACYLIPSRPQQAGATTSLMCSSWNNWRPAQKTRSILSNCGCVIIAPWVVWQSGF